jgi:hypothetical protein
VIELLLDSPATLAAAIDSAGPEEILALVHELRVAIGERQATTTLHELNYRGVLKLREDAARASYGLGYLLDQLGPLLAAPGVTIGDILKTLPADRLANLRKEMKIAGWQL